MTTDKDLEDVLRQVRLSTTAQQDERILGDALAAIDQSAVFPLRTLARSLRHPICLLYPACPAILSDMGSGRSRSGCRALGVPGTGPRSFGTYCRHVLR